MFYRNTAIAFVLLGLSLIAGVVLASAYLRSPRAYAVSDARLASLTLGQTPPPGFCCKHGAMHSCQDSDDPSIACGGGVLGPLCTTGEFVTGGCDAAECQMVALGYCVLGTVTRHVDKCTFTGVKLDCENDEWRCQYEYSFILGGADITVTGCEEGVTYCGTQPMPACDE
jgi:hypothetical protein